MVGWRVAVRVDVRVGVRVAEGSAVLDAVGVRVKVIVGRIAPMGKVAVEIGAFNSAVTVCNLAACFSGICSVSANNSEMILALMPGTDQACGSIE